MTQILKKTVKIRETKSGNWQVTIPATLRKIIQFLKLFERNEKIDIYLVYKNKEAFLVLKKEGTKLEEILKEGSLNE
jgi:hypothetical protein